MVKWKKSLPGRSHFSFSLLKKRKKNKCVRQQELGLQGLAHVLFLFQKEKETTAVWKERRKESKRAQFSFLLNLCARSLLFSFLSFQSGSWSGLTTHCFLLRERQHQLGHQALDRSLSKESKSWPGQSSRGIFSFFHTAYKRKRKRSNMWSHMRFLSFF